MVIEKIQGDFARVHDELLKGPIYPNVTPEEIRCYLRSRYDFTKAMALDEAVADVEQMLQTWQVQVTHPRYFGLFNPADSRVRYCGYACCDVQPSVGELANFAGWQ